MSYDGKIEKAGPLYHSFLLHTLWTNGIPTSTIESINMAANNCNDIELLALPSPALPTRR